jgi:hypothetical protein
MIAESSLQAIESGLPLAKEPDFKVLLSNYCGPKEIRHITG